MTRALGDPSEPERQIGHNTFGLQRQEFTQGAFIWRTPDIDDPPPVGVTAELENGWAQPALPLEKFAYRLHTDGSLEFKGHLDASGASSGTVALTLPDEFFDVTYETEPSYRPTRDLFFPTIIYDGATPQNAMVYIEAITGEVTITWPL